MLHLEGYDVERLGPGDEADLQYLHDRCSDYFQLIEGGPTRPTCASEDLAELPPGKDLADKFYLGIYDPDRKLVGALELARDLPSPGEWWLALLLLEPRVRGRGLGARVLDQAKQWVGRQGGSAISLAVLEQNARAERFWTEHGFVEVKRSAFVAATGLESRAMIMKWVPGRPRPDPRHAGRP
jgi:GNAT superfamily N-acetyltransferase